MIGATVAYTPEDKDPQRNPYPGSAHDVWLDEFVSLSVRRYRDGTMRACLAIWDKNQNRMRFHQLAAPTGGMPGSPWWSQALYRAAADAAVDAEFNPALR
jgi:hypothetical protein